ncbi:MAG TPA: hypothetical protein VFB99_15885, partial [Vicinamibacterales bacterium]|nr:hypothetical protein [Vicinamibacterales bacterium]
MVRRKQPQTIQRRLIVEQRREQNAVSLTLEHGGAVVDAAHDSQASVAACISTCDLRGLPLLPRSKDLCSGIHRAGRGNVVGPQEQIGLTGRCTARGHRNQHEYDERSPETYQPHEIVWLCTDVLVSVTSRVGGPVSELPNSRFIDPGISTGPSAQPSVRLENTALTLVTPSRPESTSSVEPEVPLIEAKGE